MDRRAVGAAVSSRAAEHRSPRINSSAVWLAALVFWTRRRLSIRVPSAARQRNNPLEVQL